jgi:hypothetical protein
MQLIALFIMLYFHIFGAEPKFLNYKTNFVVVEEIDGEIVFHDPILEDVMKEMGVAIPREHRHRFDHQERIFLGQKDFFRAFKEFYTPYVYATEDYGWVES